MQYEMLGPEDFGKGTRKRLPICFCLDVSGSMYGERMARLNDAVANFVRTINNNATAAASADVAVVTFGGYAEILKPFAQMNRQGIPMIESRRHSLTPMGEGINIALDLLEMRKKGYKDRGIRYFQPWIVIITDGKPEGKGADVAIRQAIARLNTLENGNKLNVFNIGIDDDVDYNILASLSVKKKTPIKLGSENLEDFFEYLGQSSVTVTAGGINIDNIEPFDIDKWMSK